MKKTNFIWMFLGTGSGAIMGMLMNFLMAHSLTKEDYGIFVLGITFINILSVIVGFGVPDFLVKSFAVEGRKAYQWIESDIKLFLVSFAISILITLSVVLLHIYDFKTSYFLLLIVPNIILQGLYSINNSIYQIEENFQRTAISNFLIYFVRFFSALLTFFTFKEVIPLGWYLTIISILGSYPFIKNIVRLLRKEIQLPVFNNVEIPRSKTVRETFKNTYPFGLISIFYFIYYQSNVILLSLIEGKSAVADYNAAFSIVSLAFMFPDLIFRRIYYTRIHTWATHNPKELKKFHRSSSMVLLVLALISIVAIYVTSKYLILFTAGAKYLNSIPYLRLLSIAILFKFTTAVSGVVLSTQNMIYTMMRINGLIAVVNICLNMLLIKFFGVFGAIYATLICEAILALLVIIISYKYIGRLNAV